MVNQEIMKVLWVDNDPSVVESTQLIAEHYDIDLPCFRNWEEAENELRENFDDYKAIVLDANCEFSADTVEENTFLSNVKDRMLEIFGEKKTKLPWYVLSAGTMDDFDEALKFVNTTDRKKHNDDWGQLLYYKDKRYDDGKTDLDHLFTNIRRTAGGTYTAKIKTLYADLFRTLSEQRFYLDDEIGKILTPILVSLHFPETIKETTSFSSFTQLRQVLEYLFRACNKTGLVPDDCLPKGKVNLQESLNYLAGQDCKWMRVRYGSAFNGDHIFPEIITTAVQQILKVANACTHTADEVPGRKDNVTEFLETVGSLRKLQSYALELCDIIVWYGKYVTKHPNAKENLRWRQSLKNSDGNGVFGTQQKQVHQQKQPNQQKPQAQQKQNNKPNNQPNPHTYEYRIMTAECDDTGVWHAGECQILPKNGLKRGDRIEIFRIEQNKGAKKSNYPLLARDYEHCNRQDLQFTVDSQKQRNDKNTDKKDNSATKNNNTNGNSEDPESYENRRVIVTCDKKGRWKSGKCLISPTGPLKIGDKLLLTKVEKNTGTTKSEFPVIARGYKKEIVTENTNNNKPVPQPAPQQKQENPKEEVLDRSEYAIFPRNRQKADEMD